MKNETTQFQYWIEFIREGKFYKEYLIENFPEGILNKEEADQSLTDNMRELMNSNGWDQVLQYEVFEIGKNLILREDLPEQPKIIEVEKIVTKRVKGKERIIEVEKVVHAPSLDFTKLALEGRPNIEHVYGGHLPLEIKNYNEITKQLKEVIGSKKILFLENDYGFSYSVGNFYKWTIEENIDTFSLFNVRELPKEYVASKIIEYDVLAYMTTYMHEETRSLVEFVKHLPIPKIVIECSPESHFSKHTAPQHQIFALNCMESRSNFEEWELYEEK